MEREQRISQRTRSKVQSLDTKVTKVRKLNFPEWKNITLELWILDTVQNGYKIEFSVFPEHTFVMNEIHFAKEKADIVTVEVDKLLLKCAIEMVQQVEGQFISNIFLVPKKDGSMRPVIN